VNAELTAAVLKHVRVFKMMTPAPKESLLPRDALTAGKKMTGLASPAENREPLAAGI
jgi:hypothetical protein